MVSEDLVQQDVQVNGPEGRPRGGELGREGLVATSWVSDAGMLGHSRFMQSFLRGKTEILSEVQDM